MSRTENEYQHLEDEIAGHIENAYFDSQRRMSDEECRALGMEIVYGSIFSSEHHIPPNEDARTLRMIFPILGLADPGSLPADTALIVAAMSEAGPRSVNGYPMFMSCRLIGYADAQVIHGIVVEESKRKDAPSKEAE